MGTQELKEKFNKSIEDVERKIATDKMMADVKATKTRAERQLAKEYQNYKDALEKQDYARANNALKMWNFIYKMNELANRFVLTLERIQSIQDLFNILSGTSEIFGQIMSLDNVAVMKDMRKNLKTFKVKLAQYEKNMDEIFTMIDGVFDEKPGFFARIVSKLKGKSPEEEAREMFMKNQQMILGNLNAYEASIGSTPTVGVAPAAASAPTSIGGNPTAMNDGDDIVGGI